MASTPLDLPTMPPVLKPLLGILKAANDHEKVDPIVTYWCRLYAFQLGLDIDKKSPDCLNFLTTIMAWLEKEKLIHKDNEAMSNELVAQAHIENHAMKLFTLADSQDRGSKAGRNTIKLYFTASQLFDTLNVFGEASEEVAQKSKYAKWRAAYITRCLKNGENLLPPEEEGNGDNNKGPDNNDVGTGGGSSASDSTTTQGVKPNTLDFPPQLPSNIPSAYYNQYPGYYPPPGTPAQQPYTSPSQPNPYVAPTPSPYVQPTGSTISDQPASIPSASSTTGSSSRQLDADALMQAQKFCKYAGSALQFEDINTAVANLEKALALLKTGQQS